MKYRVDLVFLVTCIAFLALAWASNDKPGSCGRLRLKRELCDCQQGGKDDCLDECSNDGECYGQRKCCTNNCRRVCSLPRIRPPQPVARPCPEQMQWDQCPALRRPTCAQPELEPIIPAPQPQPQVDCNPQCVCRQGYVATGDGTCVQKIDCPPAPPPSHPVCPGAHEAYHHCFRGCQGSCANPNAVGCVGTDCVQGCFCSDGYVRNGVGRCIPRHSCPRPLPRQPPPAPPTPACPPDQEFSLCRRDCEATCARPNPTGCQRRCQAGCFCRSGYVKDYSGKCVGAQECPVYATAAPTCPGDNEEFKICSPQCQRTCSNPNAYNCNSRCSTGCFCIEGFYRDYNGECVTECPQIAPPQQRPFYPNRGEQYPPQQPSRPQQPCYSETASCGGYCDRECASNACPNSCRRRCCRRRRFFVR